MNYKSPLCSCIVCHETKSAKGIFSHFLQNHDSNFRLEWQIKNNHPDTNQKRKLYELSKKQKKIEEYYLSPEKCCCGNIKKYEIRNNKFCSQSCAAHYTNLARGPLTEITKNKIKISVKKTKYSKSYRKKEKIHGKKYCLVHFHNCIICNKIIMSKSSKPKRKTCSRSCQTHASVGVRTYKNGRRLNIYYYNKHENKTVLLESSWEELIAKFLDENNVVWIRPKPISWIDDTYKSRLYYPDFFLPEYDVYLDPKNPTAMKIDARKMEIVSELIQLWYGDKENIKEKVLKLLKS